MNTRVHTSTERTTGVISPGISLESAGVCVESEREKRKTHVRARTHIHAYTAKKNTKEGGKDEDVRVISVNEPVKGNF